MIPARKRWGQHFLAHGGIAERIVAAAHISRDDTVIEVGPGDGALTRPLASAASRLLAIEIDPLRASHLAREFSENRQVRILQGDVLASGFSGWLAQVEWEGPAVLVANLPYNAATPILLAALEDPTAISRIVATVQREVGERFVARPGDDAYGYLSVRAAAYAHCRILFDLPRGAFRPRPKVTSSVLEFTRREPELAPRARRDALVLASLGFRFRRKMLANALASLGGRAQWAGALGELGHSPNARAEELSLEDYLALAQRTPQASP